MAIRKATQEDIPTLLQFEQALIEAERPFDPTLADSTTYYDLPAMMRADNVLLVVWEEEGQIVASGYVRIEEAKSYANYSKYGYLGFMYVRPERRGSGIIQSIIQHLMDWCKQQEIKEFRLEVYRRNNAAIRAYEKLGFELLKAEMRMQIL